jgi:hypothetical protein
MNESPDVLEQVPAGGGMNKPESGTYGEKAALADLQKQLPVQDQQQPGPAMQPTPGPMGGRPAPSSGLPPGLMAPTRQPDVPVSTPLTGQSAVGSPLAGAADVRQKRLLLLDALSQSPEVSPETREWASIMKQKLIARG